MRKPLDVLAEGLSVHQSGGGGNRIPLQNPEKIWVHSQRNVKSNVTPGGFGGDTAERGDGDSLLDRLLAAWPCLSGDDRAEVVELAERLAVDSEA
jgi:hypothetical protein